MASATQIHESRAAGSPARRGISASDRWHLRLVITLPTVLVLFTLAFGLISYFSFTSRWDELAATGAQQIVAQMFETHLIAMIGLAVLAAVVGVVLAYSILRPIRALVDATRRVALGDLDQRALEVPAAAELNKLSQSFNTMIGDLNRSIGERNRCLMEGIPNGLLTTDMEGRINAVNHAAAHILGHPVEELMGVRLSDIAESPAGMQGLSEFLARLLDLRATQAAREVTLSNEHGVGAVIVSASFLRDASHGPFGVMLTLRDAARVRDLSAQISRTDQLAMLGTFTLGLAHELRNPLGAIKGLSQLMAMEKAIPAETKGYLERMGHEVDRVDDFVRQLLDMSHQPPDLPIATNLNDLLIQASELARLGISVEQLSEVSVQRDMEWIPPLELQADRLRGAFVKILHNAYQWTPRGGRITIRTRHAWRGEMLACDVTIQNSGSNIGADQRLRIFEPFFTTRDRATGLGLTIAHQIITQNQGTLEVEPASDGVAFVARFLLPRLTSESMAGGAAPLAVSGGRA